MPHCHHEHRPEKAENVQTTTAVITAAATSAITTSAITTSATATKSQRAQVFKGHSQGRRKLA